MTENNDIKIIITHFDVHITHVSRMMLASSINSYYFFSKNPMREHNCTLLCKRDGTFYCIPPSGRRAPLDRVAACGEIETF